MMSWICAGQVLSLQSSLSCAFLQLVSVTWHLACCSQKHLSPCSDRARHPFACVSINGADVCWDCQSTGPRSAGLDTTSWQTACSIAPCDALWSTVQSLELLVCCQMRFCAVVHTWRLGQGSWPDPCCVVLSHVNALYAWATRSSLTLKIVNIFRKMFVSQCESELRDAPLSRELS